MLRRLVFALVTGYVLAFAAPALADDQVVSFDDQPPGTVVTDFPSSGSPGNPDFYPGIQIGDSSFTSATPPSGFYCDLPGTIVSLPSAPSGGQALETNPSCPGFITKSVRRPGRLRSRPRLRTCSAKRGRRAHSRGTRCAPRRTPARPPKRAWPRAAGASDLGASAGGFVITFTTWRSRVSVMEGSPGASSCVAAPDPQNVVCPDAVLTGYDIYGNPIPGAQATALDMSDGTFNQLYIATPDGSPTIAYAVISGPPGPASGPWYIDDLTVDNPGTTPPPAFRLKRNLPQITAFQGLATQTTIGIDRFNGSTGPLALSISGLPSCVTGSNFDPNPANAEFATLSLTASGSCDPTTATITATSQSPFAGTGSDSTTVRVNVQLPFKFDPVSNVSLAPCQSDSRQLFLNVAQGYTQPIQLYATTDTGATVSVSPSTLMPGDRTPIMLNVSTGRGVLHDGTITVTALAQDGSWSDAATLAVATEPTAITYVDPNGGWTPQRLNPGSTIVVGGTGFCAGAEVAFYGASGPTAPVSATATNLWVTVPRQAQTGPLGLVYAGAPNTVVAATTNDFTVHDYRRDNGYTFNNNKTGPDTITLDQLRTAFGSDQVDISIDPCAGVTVGFVSCSLVKFATPAARAFLQLANWKLDGKGTCFGMAVTAQRFMNGKLHISDYPNYGGSQISDLASPAGPSPQLQELLNATLVSQLSTQFIGWYLQQSAAQFAAGGAATATSNYNEIRGLLQAGVDPLISVRDSVTGHIVTAYDVESDGAGGYNISVYDSNDPWRATPDSNNHGPDPGVSAIHVNNDGHWWLPSTGMDGAPDELLVFSEGQLPVRPTLPASIHAFVPFSGLLMNGGGSRSGGSQGPSRVTQVTDSSGRTLFDSSGQLNSDKRTRIPGTVFAPLQGGSTAGASGQPDDAAPMIILPRGISSVTAKVTDTGSGADAHAIFSAAGVARIDTTASPGAVDTLSLNPNAASVGFTPGLASKPVGLTVITGRGTGQRAVTVQTTSFRGGGDKLSLERGGGALELVHRGPATALVLTLSGTDASGMPISFRSGRVSLPANGEVRAGGIDWVGLASGVMHLAIGGHTVSLRNTLRARSVGRIIALSTHTIGARRIAVTVVGRLGALPTGSQAAFAWIVHRGRRIVAAHSVVLHSPRPGAKTLTWVLQRRGAGRFIVTTQLVVVGGGAGSMPIALRATRSVRFQG